MQCFDNFQSCPVVLYNYSDQFLSSRFAGEVFHGLQEEATRTACRSHNLMVRIDHIEAALPPLETKLLTQTRRLHFAYTTGTEWIFYLQL